MNVRPNPNLYIPIEFQESDGVTLTARSWEDLAEKLAAYRRRTKKPIGDPLEEVFAQACSRYPDRCNGTPNGAQPRGKLSARVLSWLGRIIGEAVYVTEEEAERRAAICRACPVQRAWDEDCANCKRTIAAVVTELLGTRKRHPLVGCDVLGEDTRVSVWLELPEAGSRHLPAQCWRKKS